MTNRDLIEKMIYQTSDKEIMAEVFSDHFDMIKEPTIVSLGLVLKDKKVDDVVQILRENGIDAVPFYSPKVKDNLSCFVVDGTGVRSPVLSPEDAIKATANLFTIMQQNGIKTSRALPVSRENMIPAVAKTYNNKIIDIVGNNPHKEDVKNFVSQQLDFALKQTEANFDGRYNSLYRGGTLGDNPYAITPHQRKRDGVYATNDVKTAIEYADGRKGNGFSFDVAQLESGQIVSYGFLYEFQQHLGQRFYGMAEIESPYGSDECKGHPDNRPDYETLIEPSRNPLKAIYIKVGEKVVQIADEKGYFSDNWKKFAEIHTPYNTNEKNDFMVARINRQISEFNPVVYQREKTPLEKDTTVLQIEGLAFEKDITKNDNGDCVVSNANFSSIAFKNLDHVKFRGDFNLDNCSLSKDAKILDLSECSGIVGISGCDMSGLKEITPPKSCKLFFLENVKLAKGSCLNLENMNCHNIVFSDQDLSGLTELKLPERTNVRYKGNTIQKQTDSASKINELRGLAIPTKTPYTPQKLNVDVQTLKLYQTQRTNG